MKKAIIEAVLNHIEFCALDTLSPFLCLLKSTIDDQAALKLTLIRYL